MLRLRSNFAFDVVGVGEAENLTTRLLCVRLVRESQRAESVELSLDVIGAAQILSVLLQNLHRTNF